MSLFEFRHDGRQPLIPVYIGAPHYLGQFRLIEAMALIDTGSTTTLIAASIVRQLDLEPLGKRPVVGVHGLAYKNEFRFRIALRQKSDDTTEQPYFFPNEILGAEFHQSSRFDVILGMDLLSLGRLVLKNDGTGMLEI